MPRARASDPAPPPPTFDVVHGEESLEAMRARHAREVAAMETFVKTFGRGKGARDRALRAVGAVTDRHLDETRAFELARADAGDDDEDEDDDAADGTADGDADAAATRLATLDVDATRDDESGDAMSEKKTTKAARRRMKREAEERERERRIEAEKAALGPSAETSERETLRRELQPLGLAVKEIRADGHCLYRAIDDQLTMVRGRGHEGGYAGLRETCARTMREDEDAFRPFAEDGCGEDDDKWNDYVRAVESTATWGGQLELMALSKALERRISVYSATMPTVVMGEEFAPEGELRVAYHRHAFGLGEHYNSVEAAGR